MRWGLAGAWRAAGQRVVAAAGGGAGRMRRARWRPAGA